ncbi:hypothetical protein HDK77DRAFT_487221 [Phyllosticta capitalensis]|uniref:Major facilitator superfamily (MFS) profile domain-containing protein n=1 Tax=Phyllosticta capitalensis TaxID=121624 RepID=A0ABR1YP95_9PEZI
MAITPRETAGWDIPTRKEYDIFSWGEEDIDDCNAENNDLASASAQAKPSPWTKSMFKLYAILLLATLNSCINGYDGSLMAAINSYPQYRSYFGFDPDNGTPTTGIVYAIYQIGNLVGSFAAGPACDTFGRRWGMFTGASIIILGAGVQASSVSLAAFIGGRFVLGFGVSICATAGPAYVSEMAHPAYRGMLTGVYNTFWFAGALPGTWVPYATSAIEGAQSWRIPSWLQMLFAGIVIVGSPFVPETPRWLIANDKHDEALRVMAKYHGEGRRDCPIVQLEYKEMVADISVTGADKRWWDYRELFNTPEVRYRTFIVITFAFFNQWVGNASTSYYYPTVLLTAGIKDTRTRLLLTALLTLMALIGALVGARFTDAVGRRRQMLFSIAAIAFIWVIVMPINATNPAASTSSTDATTASSSSSSTTIASTHSRAIIALTFLLMLIYSMGITPLQALYPVECLRYESRAKGMGLYNLATNIANFYNTFVTGIAFSRLGWRYYAVFVAWDVFAVVVIWATYVETSNMTLEEVSCVFAKGFRRPRWPWFCGGRWRAGGGGGGDEERSGGRRLRRLRLPSRGQELRRAMHLSRKRRRGARESGETALNPTKMSNDSVSSRGSEGDAAANLRWSWE